MKLDNTLSIFNDNLVTVAGLPAGTIVMPDTTKLNRSLPLSGEDFWQKEARGNSSSLRLAQDNSAGNFVKVRQRIPVRIRFVDNTPEDMARLRAGMNVECKVKY